MLADRTRTGGERRDGGGASGVKMHFSVNDIRLSWLAKLSSSSASSAISSGISSVVVLYALSWTVCRSGEGSLDKDLFKDCGDVSRVCGTDLTFLVSSGRLKLGVLELDLPCVTLLRDVDRPRLSTGGDGDCTGDRRPKNILGDHGDFSALGERERAERFFMRTEEDVFKRGSGGGGGGALGVINLSAGFIVLRSPLAIELIDALRNRRGWTSIGTKRRLTG